MTYDDRSAAGDAQPYPIHSPEVLQSWDGAGQGTPLAPVQPRRRRAPWVIAAAASVVVVAGLVGGGLYAWSALNGGGDQPEQHLPATTAAVLALDLNPSLAQKVDAIRFFSRFPGSRVGAGSGDGREGIWSSIAADFPGAPAWSEVEPWLGERGAVARVPASSGGPDPGTVIVLQTTDEAKAAASLGGVKDGTVAVSHGWVYLAKAPLSARDVVAAVGRGTLAQDARFSADVAAAGERGIGAVWADSSRLQAAGGAGPGASILSAASSSWHGALTLRFTSSSLELAGSVADLPAAVPSGPSGVENLPDSSVAALAVAGLGDSLAEQWRRVTAQAGPDGAQGLEAATGLKLPGDLKALLGDRSALAIGAPDGGGIPGLGLRVWSTSPDTARVARLLDQASARQGMNLRVRNVADGYVLANSAREADDVAAGGGLGASARLKAAVPDTDGAYVVGYADVPRMLAAIGRGMPADLRKNLDPLDVVGISIHRSGDRSVAVHAILTTR